VIVLLFTLYNALQKKKSHIDHYRESKSVITGTSVNHPRKEFSTQQLKSYIIDIINHGSNQLSLKGGEMDGGFVSQDDASDVACYLLTFSGHPCKNGYPKYAASLFQSNCAGCHQVDGSGQKGIYPDLSTGHFLGIK